MENQKHIMAYYPLFEHMKNEHGLTLLESELQEIIRLSDIVKQKYNEACVGKPDSDTHGGLGLHGVSNNEVAVCFVPKDIECRFRNKRNECTSLGDCLKAN